MKIQVYITIQKAKVCKKVYAINYQNQSNFEFAFLELYYWLKMQNCWTID